MRDFVVHFDEKSCYLCAYHIGKTHFFFLNNRNRKVVGGTHNVLVHYVDVSAPESSGIVLCNPVR